MDDPTFALVILGCFISSEIQEMAILFIMLKHSSHMSSFSRRLFSLQLLKRVATSYAYSAYIQMSVN